MPVGLKSDLDVLERQGLPRRCLSERQPQADIWPTKQGLTPVEEVLDHCATVRTTEPGRGHRECRREELPDAGLKFGCKQGRGHRRALGKRPTNPSSSSITSDMLQTSHPTAAAASMSFWDIATATRCFGQASSIVATISESER